MKGKESIDGRIVLQQCVGLLSKINFFLFQLLISFAHDNNKDAWPHLPSLRNNKFLKDLRIARHNVATHQLITLNL